MRIDLKNSYSEGINNLSTWRNRYSKSEYPEKVLLNLFYRKYTMEFIWSEIINCFQKKLMGGNKVLWNDFNEGFQKLKSIYQQTATSKTQPVLLQFLSEQSQRKVGGLTYAEYSQKIVGAKSGNREDLEEIEFAYLYYLLTDECVLLWGAFGGTGKNKIDSIGQISGMIIETDEIKSYAQIESILGRLCASSYLNDVYSPLPPL